MAPTLSPIRPISRPKAAALRRRREAGFTLIEILTSVVLGMIVIGAVVTLSITTAQNFAATANYVNMDTQSRNALDNISREVRNATALASFTTNNPYVLTLTNARTAVTATITCNTNTGLLTLTKTGLSTMTLLTGCDSFSFKLCSRLPVFTSTNFTFQDSTNSTGAVDPQFCKIINMTWKCSRTILGSKLNTEVVQTAQVVLRNQVSQ